MKYKCIIFILVFFALLSGFLLKRDGPFCPGCNVIIIDIDSLRSDALSCYGYFRDTAPNLCDIAERGILFKKNYSQANWTMPSLASTLTSLYPSAHKVVFEYLDSLPKEAPTLAELFRNGGYKTKLVRYDMGSIGYLPVGFERGFDQLISRNKNDSWRQDIEEIKNEDKPFFLFLTTQALHMPYTLPPGEKLIENVILPSEFPDTDAKATDLIREYLVKNYKDIFSERAFTDYPEIFIDVKSDGGNKIIEFFNSVDKPSPYFTDKWSHVFNSYLDHIKKGDGEWLGYMRLMYDSNISKVDRQLEFLVDRINKENLSENTVIIIMSDHGQEFGEHGGYGNSGTPYRELYWTPLVAYIPRIKPDKVNIVTQNIDIAPSLMDMIGLSIPGTFQGKSWVSQITFLGKLVKRKRISVGEGGDDRIYVIDDRFRLIVDNIFGNQPEVELFDLEADPYEQNNILDRFPAKAKKLFKTLLKIIKESQGLYEKTTTKFPSFVNEDKIERLKKEGYF